MANPLDPTYVSDAYRLPSGEVVRCDASATKGARVIDFTLKGGQIVQATLVRAAYTPADADADACRLTLIEARAKYARCLIISRAMGDDAILLYCQDARQALALAAAEVDRYDGALGAADRETEAVEDIYRGSRP